MESDQIRLSYAEKLLKIVQMKGWILQWEAVREMKESGLSSEEAYNILIEMLEKYPEYYDVIADILDVISWWCNPQWHIWESKYVPPK